MSVPQIKQKHSASRLRSLVARRKRGPLVSLLSAFVFAVCFVPSANAQPTETRIYVVKERDTCVRIAEKELGKRSLYKVIHKHNALGPLPHKLKPGQKLNLPVSRQKSQAILSVKRGPVRFRPATITTWDSAKPGMDLYQAWRVNSRKQAAAELTFRDKSKLSMRENTVVIVYGRNSQRKESLTRAVLESGALRTRLSDLLGGKGLVVETPSSEAEVGSGSTLISVDSDGTSRIANHRGKGVTVKSKPTKKRRKRRKRAQVRVAAGFGSKVKLGLPPSKPKPLPPAPIWLPGRMAGVGFADTGVSFGRGWQPVEVASSYRVEISRTKEMDDIVATVIAPSKVTNFVAHRLPKGSYFVRVSSIDSDGFESVPSVTEEAQAYILRDASREAPVETPPGSSVQASDVPELRTIPNGTNFEAPEGITCSIGKAPKTSTITLLKTGPQQLVCADSQGEIGPLLVEVAAPTSLHVLSKNGAQQELARDVATRIDLELRDHVATSGQHYEVLSSSPDVLIGKITQTQGKLQVLITPQPSAGQSVEITIRVAGQSDPAPLATTTLTISPKPEVELPEPAPPESKLGGSLSIFGTGAKSDSTENFGGGFRLAAQLSRWFAEGEMQMLDGDCERPFIGCQLSFRGHLGVNVLRTQSVDLFGLVGAGTRSELGEGTGTDATGHYGAGARYLLGKRVWLRADARHIVSPGLTHTFEFHLGIQQSFGASRD